MMRPIAVRVVVTNGLLESATLLCIPPLSADDCQVWHKLWNEDKIPDTSDIRPLTIPQLFDFIDHSRTLYNAKVRVELDATYGYPRHYWFDVTTATDAMSEFEVVDFKVTQ